MEYKNYDENRYGDEKEDARADAALLQVELLLNAMYVKELDKVEEHLKKEKAKRKKKTKRSSREYGNTQYLTGFDIEEPVFEEYTTYEPPKKTQDTSISPPWEYNKIPKETSAAQLSLDMYQTSNYMDLMPDQYRAGKWKDLFERFCKNKKIKN